MRIIVPSLKIFQANFSHEMKLNNKAKFELGRLANLTKQDKAAFVSLAHSMVDDWQDYRSGIFETNLSLFSWEILVHYCHWYFCGSWLRTVGSIEL